MQTFKAYFKKEVLEAVRTNKYIILFVGTIFWALLDPLLLKLLPIILESSLPVDMTSLLPELTREMNQYVGLDLAMTKYALGAGSGGSDHSSFASVKIPFVYYMAAMTSDYHRPSDSVEKVSGELIAKISRHGFLTVFAFANK